MDPCLLSLLLACPERTEPSTHPASVARRALGWAACHERVAVHVERAGVVLAFGAAKGVDRLAGHHVSEPAVLEHLLPARTGQPASYSTGPQVDVTQRLGRHGGA